MALFDTTEEVNQHYIDFMNSQKVSIEELKAIKMSLFELTKGIHTTLLGATKENTSTLKSLYDHLNPPGAEARSYGSLKAGGDREGDNETLKFLKDFMSKIPLPGEGGGNVKTLLDEIGSLIVTGLLALVALPFMGPIIKWFDDNFGTNIKASFDKIIRPFEGYITRAHEAVVTLTTWLHKTIDWFKLLMNDPKEALLQAWEGLKNLGHTIHEKLKPFIKAGEEVFNSIYTYLKDQLKIYFDQFLDFLGGATKTNNVFENAYNKISSYFNSFISSIKKWSDNNGFHDVFQTMKGYFTTVLKTGESFMEELKPLYAGSKNIFATTMHLLGTIWDSGVIQQKITNIVGDVTDAVKKKADKLWDSLSTILENLLQNIGDRILLSIAGNGKKKNEKGDEWNWFPDVDPTEWIPGVKEARERMKEKENKELLEQKKTINDKKLRDETYDNSVQNLKNKLGIESPNFKKVMDGLSEGAASTEKSLRAQADYISGAISDALKEYQEADKQPIIIQPPAKNSSPGSMTPIPTMQSNEVGRIRGQFYSTRPSFGVLG